MNNIINKFLLAGDKFMPEMHLRQPRFVYGASGILYYIDPIFAYHTRLVNILDFNPEKLSIEKVHAINDELERIYYVKYDGGPFYLIIDDLKDYFKYSKEKDTTELTAEPSSSERNSLECRKELEFIIKYGKK